MTKRITHNLKHTIVAAIIVTLLAPGFYFGLAPQPVEAQLPSLGDTFGLLVQSGFAVSACLFGGVLAQELMGLAGSAFKAILTTVSDFFSLDMLGGIMSAFGLNFLSGIPIISALLGSAVPTDERNTQVTGNLTAINETKKQGEFRECVIDPLIWTAKEYVIQVITNNIISWIQTGFADGSPMFVTNPAMYFRDVAYDSVSAFLDESGVESWLCDPYATNVVQNV